MKYRLYRNKETGKLLLVNTKTGERIAQDDSNFREHHKKYQNNLRRAQRDEAMRSIGLVKTPYGWE